MRTLCIGMVLVVVAAFEGTGAGQDQPRVIRISAERFSFAPSEVQLTAGEDVVLRLESDDTDHGFRILGTTTNVTIPKRGKGEVSVPIRFDEPGRYTFECSRMCGAGHNFMRGVLVVRAQEKAGAGQ